MLRLRKSWHVLLKCSLECCVWAHHGGSRICSLAIKAHCTCPRTLHDVISAPQPRQPLTARASGKAPISPRPAVEPRESPPILVWPFQHLSSVHIVSCHRATRVFYWYIFKPCAANWPTPNLPRLQHTASCHMPRDTC